MTKCEEIESLYSLLSDIARGPQGLFSAWPSGMPRMTGDYEIALLQRDDINDAIDRLEELLNDINSDRKRYETM